MNDKKKSASSEFEGMSGDKQKALTAALAQIEKQFGKGSIMRLGDAEINQDIQVVSSGSLGLDIALGVGGMARAATQGSAPLPLRLPEHCPPVWPVAGGCAPSPPEPI